MIIMKLLLVCLLYLHPFSTPLFHPVNQLLICEQGLPSVTLGTDPAPLWSDQINPNTGNPLYPKRRISGTQTVLMFHAGTDHNHYCDPAPKLRSPLRVERGVIQMI